ncbi:hypothetical protein AWC35_00545 [Gibbsiella quercinecans]|uniref:Uncharacterized protein n=1 Tax=Gibbsiella quercinecans TaxID=929813 RepID=A0A250AVG8_9GAMM|nr:hypothetical protein AWC35_00545 [Gibbsiella quercinecans]
MALGGALGYAGGGWMYDTGRALAMPEMPWLMLGIVGFATLATLYRQFTVHSAAPAVLRGH